MCKSKAKGGFRCSSEAKKVRQKLMAKLEPYLTPGTLQTLSTPLASVLHPEAHDLLNKVAKNEVLSSAPSEKEIELARKAREEFRLRRDSKRFQAIDEAYKVAQAHRNAVAVRSVLEDYITRYKAGERLGLTEQVKVGSVTIVSAAQAARQYRTLGLAEQALAQGNMFIEGTQSAKNALDAERRKAKVVFNDLVAKERAYLLKSFQQSQAA